MLPGIRQVIFLSMTLVASAAYSQDSLRTEYRSAISIELLAPLARTISLSYARKLNDKVEWIINPKYQFHGKARTHTWIFSNANKDPRAPYNNISVNSGFRIFIEKKMYIEPLIILKYGFYNNTRFDLYEDREGDLSDLDYVISRKKRTGGSVIKIGFLEERKRIRFNFFAGVGYRFTHTRERIEATYNWLDELVENNYPIRSSYSDNYLTIHGGVEIGIKI